MIHSARVDHLFSVLLWFDPFFFPPLLSVDRCSKDVTEQRVQTDGHADRLPPRGDHHAVAGPPQHHQALWRGAHATPEDGKMISVFSGFDLFGSRNVREYLCFSGNRAGTSGFAIRYPAHPSVRVPPGPPLALCDSNSIRYGLPGDQEVNPQGSGCQKHPVSFQGDGQDRGFWSHARTEPRDGSLRDVGSQKDPVCMVRAVGKRIRPGLPDKKNQKRIAYRGFPGVLQRASAWVPSPTPQMCGCLESPCGRCSHTARSPGSACQEDRYALVSLHVSVRNHAPPVCAHVSRHSECDPTQRLFVPINPDLVARGTRGRASGETAGLSPGAVCCHAEVLGLQPQRQAKLHPARHVGGRGGFSHPLIE